MKLADIIRRAGRSLGQAKIRTLLTSLAIGVGAFTLTLALSAGNGSRHYIDQLVSANANTQTLAIVSGDLAEPNQNKPQEYGAKPSGSQPKLIGQSDIKQLKQIDGIKRISPNYQVDAQYVTRPGQKKYTVPAVADSSNELKMNLLAGQVPADGVKDGTVVMPDSFLGSLGFKSAQAAIGKKLTISYQRPTAGLPEVENKTYKIAAVETKPDEALSYQPKFTISSHDLKSVYDFERRGTPGYGEFISVTATVKKGADFDQVEQTVKNMGYSAFSAKEIQKTLFQFIDIVQYGVAGFGALAILAAVFGIINTQYISVLERTRQIGLMKALGMRRRDVMRLFLFEAAWIGALGGVIGASLAGLVGLAANPFISDRLSLGDSKLLLFSWLPTIILVAALVVIAMLAGFFPARKAAKLDPVEALRTE